VAEVAGARNSPAPFLLQRLPFSSAYPSPATSILQRLPFSGDYHSPTPAILQHLPFSPAPPAPYHSPATLCTFFLQLLPFMLIHEPLFRLCPTEAIIMKSASIISNVVRAVDSGLVNISQKEGRTKGRGVDLIYPDLSLLGICRLHTSLQFLSHVCCLFQLPKSRQMKWASVRP
jgi:hypothetical protein